LPRILGVDPGLTRCGVGVIDLDKSRQVKLVEVDTYRSDPKDELALRIGSLGDQIEALIVRTQPDAIAIERVFSQQNLSTVMGTAQISGVVMMLAHKHRIPVAMHTPTEVKAAVTGSGRAGKEQVGAMVARILGLNEVPKPADAADSLAIAICHGWKTAGATVASAGTATKAQLAWHAAEKASKASKK